jgi:hypothetical protein
MATPPDFTAGAVLTAAQMDAVGLWLILSEPVGSGVSEVVLEDIFSADFDSYKITWTGGNMNALQLIGVYLAAGGGSNYQGARTSSNTSSAISLAADLNAGQWSFAGAGNADTCVISLEIHNPFLAKRTHIQSQYYEPYATFGTYTGILNDATSYTDLTIDPQGAGTMSNGTIRVYGYRN